MKYFLLALLSAFTFQVQASQLSIQIGKNSNKIEDYLFYDFGTVFTNTRTAVRYTVTNNGMTPLNFLNAYVYGSDFSAIHSCTGLLLPGARCEFEISYWPLFEGISSGRFVMNFVENDNITVDVRGMARRM
jgi:hypothetical protein